MKAAVIDRYGPASSFKLREMPEPEIKDSEILVKVRASSVNPVDWKIRQGKLKLVSGTNFPKILGADFAGEVVKTGSNIEGYKAGDQVFGMINAVIGGAYAEYLKVKPKHLAPMPKGLTAEEAASIPLVGLTALQGLRDQGQLSPKEKVLINGASGGVGTLAVQIAKSIGATVTGVCSTSNLQAVKDLGADEVIDYTKEEVLKSGDKYHLIFDTHGNLSFNRARKCLYDGGCLVSTLPSPKGMLQILLSKLNRHKGMKTFFSSPSHEDLLELKRLAESGKLRPVIHETYPLQNLREAHEQSEHGHLRGKLVIRIDSNS